MEGGQEGNTPYINMCKTPSSLGQLSLFAMSLPLYSLCLPQALIIAKEKIAGTTSVTSHFGSL